MLCVQYLHADDNTPCDLGQSGRGADHDADIVTARDEMGYWRAVVRLSGVWSVLRGEHGTEIDARDHAIRRLSLDRDQDEQREET